MHSRILVKPLFPTHRIRTIEDVSDLCFKYIEANIFKKKKPSINGILSAHYCVAMSVCLWLWERIGRKHAVSHVNLPQTANRVTGRQKCMVSEKTDCDWVEPSGMNKILRNNIFILKAKSLWWLLFPVKFCMFWWLSCFYLVLNSVLFLTRTECKIA